MSAEFIIENQALIRCKQDELTETLTIPDGVEKIMTLAFLKCECKEIIIPPSVKIMEYGAFQDCPKLERITIPPTVKTLKNSLFYECHCLKEVMISEGITEITSSMFENCENLETVHLPESLKVINASAFSRCRSLQEITIPENVTELKAYTFKNCYSLKEVHFPKKLTDIGDSCFRNCKSLEEVIFPNGTKDIIAGAFNGCEKLKKIVIPETVTWVGYSFSSCPELEKILCHGIEIKKQDLDKNSETASIFVWMIVRKDFEARRLPDSKYRIIYEMFLRNQDNQKINAYIKENFAEIIKILIQENQIQLVQNYMKSFRRYTTAQNLDEFIRFAIDEQKYEIQIFLTNLKYQRNDFTEKDWTL